MKTLTRWLGVAALLVFPAWGGSTLQAQEFPGDELPQLSLEGSAYDTRSENLPLPDAPLPDVRSGRTSEDVSFYDPSG
ncbi:MAG TPA: hypothetical protein PKO06_23945, partial [Candidatus Ozemobacteraceae bacterium]|nr:hypothetical protein [Candidatus Ozemobacteraceae bacterium]